MTEKRLKPDNKAQFIVKSMENKSTHEDVKIMSENYYELRKNSNGKYSIFTDYDALIISNIKDKELAQRFLEILNMNQGELNLWIENYNILEEGCEEYKNKMEKENEELKQENRKLKEDLEHCANQFTNDGKNVLLSLR